MGEGRSVLFEWPDPEARSGAADTQMIGREAGVADYRWRVIYSGFRRGFWPSATLFALTVAVPMSRLRMALALPFGLMLFNGFFLAQVAVLAWLLFAATGSIPGVSESTWREMVPVAKALFNSPITNFASIFAIWAVLARPDHGVDLSRANALLRPLLGPRGAAPAESPGAAPAAPEAEARDDGDPGSA